MIHPCQVKIPCFMLLLLAVAMTAPVVTSLGIAKTTAISRQHLSISSDCIPSPALSNGVHRRHNCHPRPFSFSCSSSHLSMATDDEDGDLGRSIGAGFLLALFLAGSLLPLFDATGGMGDRDLSISDSVVTRQDARGRMGTAVESKSDQLSRASIQEKLNAIPVFYLATGSSGSAMASTDIYLSYEDAKLAASVSSSSIKATSLDQVMYPLVLQRGRMRMATPPIEIEKAETDLRSGGPKMYRLIPSKTALQQARELDMDLGTNDIPLFVADRLAFASPKGPQLPLFVDKSDCTLSYQRLRQGKSSLPEQPTIRTTSLLDTLDSMERGTRPGARQLAFYATAEDLAKAADLSVP